MSSHTGKWVGALPLHFLIVVNNFIINNRDQKKQKPVFAEAI